MSAFTPPVAPHKAERRRKGLKIVSFRVFTGRFDKAFSSADRWIGFGVSSRGDAGELSPTDRQQGEGVTRSACAARYRVLVSKHQIKQTLLRFWWCANARAATDYCGFGRCFGVTLVFTPLNYFAYRVIEINKNKL